MAKRRKFEKGNFYHSYSRGVNKDLIFKDHWDYLKFQQLIDRFNCVETQNQLRIKKQKQTKLTDIFCYVLMPNHFHFVLKELADGGISKFFQKVLSGYTLYFNQKYKRMGTLFESRFKDKLIDSEQYFSHLVQYIHNNPIKIINPTYNSKDLLDEKIKLSKEDRDFARNYPYKNKVALNR
jgi:putative transposase